MAEENGRISVSEDKLYRALGDLELRLVKHLNDALGRKAEAAQVISLESRVSSLEDSRIARAHIELDVEKDKARIDSLERESLDHKAVRRAFRFAVGSLLVGLVEVSLNVVLILYYHP